MSKATTHYDVLQVRQDASQEVIEGAYRALSKRFHPDLQRGNEEQMKAINVAYTVLRSPEMRHAYDRMLRLTVPPEAPIVHQPAPNAESISSDFADEPLLEEQLRFAKKLLKQYRRTIDALREENQWLESCVKRFQRQNDSLVHKQKQHAAEEQTNNELNDSVWFQLSISPRLAGVIYTLIVLGVVAAMYYAM